MPDNVVNIWDFKRREERIREAAEAMLADPLVRAAIHRRFAVEDTAPCEMPPVQPMYVAPEKDPA